MRKDFLVASLSTFSLVETQSLGVWGAKPSHENPSSHTSPSVSGRWGRSGSQPAASKSSSLLVWCSSARENPTLFQAKLTENAPCRSLSFSVSERLKAACPALLCGSLALPR